MFRATSVLLPFMQTGGETMDPGDNLLSNGELPIKSGFHLPFRMHHIFGLYGDSYVPVEQERRTPFLHQIVVSTSTNRLNCPLVIFDPYCAVVRNPDLTPLCIPFQLGHNTAYDCYQGAELRENLMSSGAFLALSATQIVHATGTTGATTFLT